MKDLTTDLLYSGKDLKQSVNEVFSTFSEEELLFCARFS